MTRVGRRTVEYVVNRKLKDLIRIFKKMYPIGILWSTVTTLQANFYTTIMSIELNIDTCRRIFIRACEIFWKTHPIQKIISVGST